MKLPIARALFALFLVFAVSVANIVHSDTVTITNLVEGQVNDVDRDGVWETLENGPLINLLAYRSFNSTGYYYRPLVEFGIGQLQDATIQNAVLRMGYAGSSGSPALTLQFYGYSGDGTISVSDAQTGASSAVGPTYNSFGPASGNYYDIPVTNFLQSLVDSNATHAGFMAENIVGNQTALGGSLSLNAPQLFVEFTPIPEPSSCLLGSFMIVGLLKRRRPIV